MKAWKRFAKVAIHTILITVYASRGLLYVASPHSVASAINGSPLQQHYLQDWQTLYLNGEPYTIRLYLNTDTSIDAPLGDSNLILVDGIITVDQSGARIDDADLERQLILLAQNRAIWDSGTDWWNDSGDSEHLGDPFRLLLHDCDAMVLSALNPFYKSSIQIDMQVLVKRQLEMDIDDN